jgi:Flp pilus assembly pilin Flp
MRRRNRESMSDARQDHPQPFVAPSVATRIVSFVRSDDGQTLVEYALVLMFIAIACIVILNTLGNVLINTYWNRISNALP